MRSMSKALSEMTSYESLGVAALTVALDESRRLTRGGPRPLAPDLRPPLAVPLAEVGAVFSHKIDAEASCEDGTRRCSL